MKQHIRKPRQIFWLQKNKYLNEKEKILQYNMINTLKIIDYSRKQTQNYVLFHK